MPTYQRGNFSIQLEFQPRVGPLAKPDRQLAWRTYLQIANCHAVRGGQSPEAAEQLDWQSLPQSIAEIKSLSRQLLEIAQQYPMDEPSKDHDDLPTLLAQILEVVLNPLIQAWAPAFELDGGPSSAAASNAGQKYNDDLKQDWTSLRRFFSDLMDELVQKYGFVCLQSTLPKHIRIAWREQAARIASGSHAS